MRMKGRKVIFDRKDTWDLRTVLSPVILEGLKKFKEVISGDDCAFKGVPHAFVDESVEDSGYSKWLEAIDKMIYAFDNMDPEFNPNDLDLGFDTLDGEDFADMLNREKTTEQSANWDICRAEEEAIYVKMKEGTALFQEHYGSLWW